MASETHSELCQSDIKRLLSTSLGLNLYSHRWDPSTEMISGAAINTYCTTSPFGGGQLRYSRPSRRVQKANTAAQGHFETDEQPRLGLHAEPLSRSAPKASRQSRWQNPLGQNNGPDEVFHINVTGPGGGAGEASSSNSTFSRHPFPVSH